MKCRTYHIPQLIMGTLCALKTPMIVVSVTSLPVSPTQKSHSPSKLTTRTKTLQSLSSRAMIENKINLTLSHSRTIQPNIEIKERYPNIFNERMFFLWLGYSTLDTNVKIWIFFILKCTIDLIVFSPPFTCSRSIRVFKCSNVLIVSTV